MNREEKQTMRAQMRARLRAQGAEDRAKASRVIADRVATRLAALSARRVFGFAPMADEPNWLEAGARVRDWRLALPRVVGDEIEFHWVDDRDALVAGAFGILEPVVGAMLVAPIGDADVILVPGLAFDRAGYRLGRGRGFYDRLLGGVERGGIGNAAIIGVAFGFQVVDAVPRESHDARIDGVITDLDRDL